MFKFNLFVFTTFALLVCQSGSHAALAHSFQDDEHNEKSIEGKWTVHPAKTIEINKERFKGKHKELMAVLKQMTLELRANKSFTQKLPGHEITGKWSVKASKESSKNRTTVQLTLIPDNLGEDHEDMIFRVRFINKNLIQADPVNGRGGVVFQRSSAANHDKK